jgi:hypothetical protein
MALRNSGEHKALELIERNGDEGNIVEASTIDPVLEALKPVDVILNMNLAYDENRPDCIRVTNLPGWAWLTAAQARQLALLAIQLTTAAETVAAIRTQLGYDQ